MSQARERRDRPVVVTIPDPSDPATSGLRTALDVAAVARAPLVLAHWVDQGGELGAAVRSLDAIAARLRTERGVDASVEVRRGASLPEMVQAIDPLVCVSASRGTVYEVDHLVGSSTEEMVRLLDAPVLAVGPQVPPDSELDIIELVAAIEPAGGDVDVVAAASGWATILGVPLRLARVYVGTEPPAPDPAWRTGRCDDRHGVAEVLVDLAGPSGLLALTSHARSGLDRLVLGSVAADVVARAPRPVLLVKSGGPA